MAPLRVQGIRRRHAPSPNRHRNSAREFRHRCVPLPRLLDGRWERQLVHTRVRALNGSADSRHERPRHGWDWVFPDGRESESIRRKSPLDSGTHCHDLKRRWMHLALHRVHAPGERLLCGSIPEFGGDRHRRPRRTDAGNCAHPNLHQSTDAYVDGGLQAPNSRPTALQSSLPHVRNSFNRPGPARLIQHPEAQGVHI